VWWRWRGHAAPRGTRASSPARCPRGGRGGPRHGYRRRRRRRRSDGGRRPRALPCPCPRHAHLQQQQPRPPHFQKCELRQRRATANPSRPPPPPRGLPAAGSSSRRAGPAGRRGYLSGARFATMSSAAGWSHLGGADLELELDKKCFYTNRLLAREEAPSTPLIRRAADTPLSRSRSGASGG
jgi:hypothetical protein